MNLKHALKLLEEFDDALQLLEQAHAMQPNDPEIFLTIGSICSLRGQHNEAIENYHQALELAEEKDEVYYNIGLAYQSMEERHARQVSTR